MPNLFPKHVFFRWIVLRGWGVIWHPFFGDLSQSEELSEIKPPLVAVFCMAEKSARLVDSRPKMKKCNFSDSFFGKLRLKVMVIKNP